MNRQKVGDYYLVNWGAIRLKEYLSHSSHCIFGLFHKVSPTISFFLKINGSKYASACLLSMTLNGNLNKSSFSKILVYFRMKVHIFPLLSCMKKEWQRRRHIQYLKDGSIEMWYRMRQLLTDSYCGCHLLFFRILVTENGSSPFLNFHLSHSLLYWSHMTCLIFCMLTDPVLIRNFYVFLGPQCSKLQILLYALLWELSVPSPVRIGFTHKQFTRWHFDDPEI